MDNAIHRRGATVALDFFNNGNVESLRRVINDCNSTDRRRKEIGRIAFGAALVSLARVLTDSRRCGVRFIGEHLPSVDEVAYAVAVEGKELDRVAQLLINTTWGVRRGMPGLTASIRDQEAPQPPRTTEPMPVQVISMPARKTVTDVSYNLAGEIATAMQIESDFR